jgi:hypothetical protein
MTTAFFYGTLMHPQILLHVVGNDGAHLALCPAILSDFARHRVQSEQIFKRVLTSEERSVRGILVMGLTTSDMNVLDNFEGDQYVRRQVSVHPLEEFQPITAHSTRPQRPDQLLSPLTAQTYIFCDVDDLQADLWSYEDFLRDHARKWY